MLDKEVISSLDEDDLGALPRLTVDDILVDVCHDYSFLHSAT